MDDITATLMRHIEIIENNQSFTGISESKKESIYANLQTLARHTLLHLVDINDTTTPAGDTSTSEIIAWLGSLSFTADENDNTFFAGRVTDYNQNRSHR